ncbi:hypothetical protein GPA27_01860 [Aromatoleum toluolicum]|uniref:HTH cro/C1-type domain-containing protein n=1 Tax=Aromatoleum toluolicum TaxID=90060 RepID=A0ABX1NA28_9RHOO|nr:helix-turn-helix transcriptional regulator [Aromatoleum toluolicum]NMF96142.1 hypothetical protein [Aromatoleum toluolicum]
MSMFESRSTTQYVAAMTKFLRTSRREFAVASDRVGCGRRPRPDAETVQRVEQAVNRKAEQAESARTTFGERYRIARDYRELRDSQVGRYMEVSRELARRWGENRHPPRGERLERLAEFLQVPKSWLLSGCLDDLGADSHIGVRVGEEALRWREVLYSLTHRVLEKVDDDAQDEDFVVAINRALVSNADVRNAARRAGGRWQVIDGRLFFASWVPLELGPLTRRYWPEETEAIIDEEVARHSSTYAAWRAVQARCEAAGLPYPQRIALHKRQQKVREHVERYGVVMKQ